LRTDLPNINLGRYYLRTILESDYKDFFEIGSDEQTVKNLPWGPYVKPKEARDTIRDYFLERPKKGIPAGYAICDSQNNDKMIGMIDFQTYYASINTAEIGYILHRSYWNQGIMKMCLKEMTKIGFEFLFLDKILVGHTLANQASKQVILQSGYHYEYQSLIKIKNYERIAMYYSMTKYEYERMYE